MSNAPTIITQESVKEIQEIVDSCKLNNDIPFGIALLTVEDDKIGRHIFHDNEEDKFYTVILTQELLHLNSDTIFICRTPSEVKEVVLFLIQNIDFYNDNTRTFEI